MTFIVVPSTSFDGLNLTTLAGASVHQAKRFDLDPGTYRLISARSPSPVFTTSGSNAVLGGLVSGSDPTFLIAPEASFSGDQLISLTGAVISRSTNVTGLLGTVSYRAIVLTPVSNTFDISLSWIVVDTVITQAPTPTNPTTPVIVDGVVTGPAGVYRFTNSTTSTVLDLYAIPPISLFDFGLAGETVTVEHWTFSLEGPDITLPVSPQITVSAVGTLSRSGATVTLTAATWDTAGVTVTRTKTISGLTSALVGTTFDVGYGESYYVSETATKTGFIASAPAETATGTRPAASPTYVGGKTAGFSGGTSDNTVTLTGLTGGSDTAPQAGDIVIIGFGAGYNTGALALTIVSSGYTTIGPVSANDSYDTTLVAGHKIMSGTPDTDVVVSGTMDLAAAGVVTVHVWRGVSSATPMDVTPVTKADINTGRPTPDPITPTTSGAVIVMMGASAGGATGAVFTSDLSNFISRYQSDTYRTAGGVGSANWTGGTYTPTQWGGNNSGASYGWCAVTLALRPQI